MPHIPPLVHDDQAGFHTQREARENTTRSIDLIHAARSKTRPMLLLSTDAENVFDQVYWQFLRTTLIHIDLGGEHMQSWIQAL